MPSRCPGEFLPSPDSLCDDLKKKRVKKPRRVRRSGVKIQVHAKIKDNLNRHIQIYSISVNKSARPVRRGSLFLISLSQHENRLSLRLCGQSPFP
jgi:hypothetical protein